MKKILPLLISIFFLLFLSAPAFAGAKEVKEEQLKKGLYLNLKGGRVVIMLTPELAPHHVERIKELTKKGFYNGLPFYRVIDGFMVQSGDPKGTGEGGSDLPNLKAEFSKDETFARGTVGMARTMDPDSANSQFFICLEAAPWLDGKYTIVGKVVLGMEYVDQIKKGDPETGKVVDPDKIVTMETAVK